jgi:periplasmic protein TonB
MYPKTLSFFQRHRISLVSGLVVFAHAGFILLVSLGLLNMTSPRSDTDQIIMTSVIMDAPAPPAPKIQPEIPKAQPKRQPQIRQAQAIPQLEPTPVVTTVAPSAATPTVSAAPPATGNQRPSTVAASPPVAAVVLPSSDTDYLNNPAPAYPRLSKRMGEQGTVVLRVFISTDGRAEKAEVRTSSGYARLDEIALATVQRWRYVPGKRAGAVEAMWFNIPIRFVLD